MNGGSVVAARPGDRRGEGPPEIDLDKLIADSLYLDNQAHVVVSRMRDMDSGTKSQLRRLYNAVRRATRAPESERQHEFVMVRARLGVHHRAPFAAQSGCARASAAAGDAQERYARLRALPRSV